MSYNVHSCIGMDGRVSPRRIARVIAEQSPDLVALQELDHGRLRSRGEDQASTIAQILGYHVTFLATVTRGAERYGHAVLSRWPIRTVKVAELPTHSFSIWPEPRGALWSRVFLGNIPINIVTTHLGLSARERLAQMQTLLGPEWLGPILDTQAIVLCGDFNLPPGTAPYRLAADRLHDVASNGPRRCTHSFRPGHLHGSTTSLCPLTSLRKAYPSFATTSPAFPQIISRSWPICMSSPLTLKDEVDRMI